MISVLEMGAKKKTLNNQIGNDYTNVLGLGDGAVVLVTSHLDFRFHRVVGRVFNHLELIVCGVA
jgi:hypothetical protein